MWGALVASASSVPNSSLNECTTQACQEAAKSIREYVDFNADPCTDFYQYTCKHYTYLFVSQYKPIDFL